MTGIRPILILLFPVVLLAQPIDITQWERILLPLANRPTPGGFGSLWESSFVLYNAGAHTLDPNIPLSDIFPFDSGCYFPPCAKRPLIPPGTASAPMLWQTKVGHPPGLLLYVRRTLVDDVAFNLRIQDVSRQALTWGTEIPVVRERELRTGVIDLLDVPTDGRFRVALRVYDPYQEPRTRPDATTSWVKIELFSMESQELIASRTAELVQPPIENLCGAPTAGITCWPGSFEIHHLVNEFPAIAASDRIRVRITPLTPGLRMWAFANVTNNETQHVTTITPH
ncbi:MAG TPA: hypothetical protein VGF40_17575 [Thermoanaerobaculia bacterium]